MNSHESITALRKMQSQVIGGSKTFGQITDCIQHMGEQLDALLAHCGKENGECSECGKIICPHKDEMHFHHDGCPSCVYEGQLKSKNESR